MRDLGALASDVVVHAQLQIQVGRSLLVDLTQEVQELLVPMVCAIPRSHSPMGLIEGREQGRAAAADVGVGDAFDVAKAHREQWLRPLKCLDPALLIDAQHPRMISRVPVGMSTDPWRV